MDGDDFMRRILLQLVLAFAIGGTARAQPNRRAPIIDMHLHAPRCSWKMY
jgi:hypothetical protein